MWNRKFGRNADHRKAMLRNLAEVAPKYAERHGGYTRVIKTGVRRGDAAPMAFIELV